MSKVLNQAATILNNSKTASALIKRRLNGEDCFSLNESVLVIQPFWFKRGAILLMFY